MADADAISGSTNEPSPKNSKGLNTTPIVWICVILVAVLLLVIFCVVGHRRQGKREALVGPARKGEERRLPQAGIVA
jgi:heme/copper-type cytochrome/quinol oxidase subunit 2